jgi:aminoglycoside 6-adenylyltransferase
MRSEKEMMDLILTTAKNDERVRAVIMNGSRISPGAPSDIFQDFDIIYVVTEIASFRENPNWIDCFGELMILQLPDDMDDPPPKSGMYGYLMQFADGNRIDLTLYPLDRLNELVDDSLSLALLDKDDILPYFPPPNDSSYLPKPPTAKQFFDCCNEFWWVCPYVAKGLWREEIVYAKFMMEIVREELLKMLNWYVGVKYEFSKSPGKYGKYLKNFLEPELWQMLLDTYADASYTNTWDALVAMGDLFRRTAIHVAGRFNYIYPYKDDANVSAHLSHVRALPKDAQTMY